MHSWRSALNPRWEPLVLHAMTSSGATTGARAALCGITAVAWRCVDDDNVDGTECADCAVAAAAH